MNGADALAVIDTYLDSHLAVITLKNSVNGNVLNRESLKDLIKAVSSGVKEKEARALLLRSDGSNFCLGMDLAMLQSIDTENDDARKTVSSYVELLTLIYTSPKPVICLINGAVKAGGVGLACVCDIIVASERSTFELSEVFFGLIPANVLPFIYSLRIPPQKARYLILTAKRLNAEEAKELHLVDEVFEEEGLEKGLKGIIKNIFRASPKAMAEAKKFTGALYHKNVKDGSDLARDKLLEMIADPKVKEGIRAFNEGSFPEWFEKFKPEKPLL
ncbi:MAG: enoyl-CoA hydratase/isomerase family protein [Spirochaetes bacterium]|nr:enoyl-CoA hydratase/isomerase family protein [Spirochaetota bacterium]